MRVRSVRSADGQAIDNVGPVAAFVGIAVITAGVMIFGTLDSSAEPARATAPQVVAAAPRLAPAPVALSPDAVDKILTVNTIVDTSGLRASAAAPTVASPAATPAASAAVAVKPRAPKDVKPQQVERPVNLGQEKAHEKAQKRVDHRAEKAEKQAQKAEKQAQKAEKQAQKAEKRAEKASAKHKH